MTNSELTCLIVEDHPQAQEWLARAVKEAFHTTAEICDTVEAANRLLKLRLPDVALIDLGLPDGHGQEVIRTLAKMRQHSTKEVTIVVSTVMNDDESIFSALRAGATGYILKDESQSALIDMLQGIKNGKPPLSPAIAARLLEFFQDESTTEPLSPRETEALELLAKGFTVPRVGELMGITKSTAQSYVKDIYRKLDVSSRAEATQVAVKKGLV